MKITLNILSLALLCIFFACESSSDTDTNIEALLKKRHLDNFKLVRTVKNAEQNFELQLRSTQNDGNTSQQVIVLTNKSKQSYILPFPSNTYRDYWNFQFENTKKEASKITFETEFKTAINTLQLNDTLGTAWLVMDEMLFSLLHCVNITESDSSKLFAMQWVNHPTLPDENLEEAHARLHKNYKMMQKDWHPHEFMTYYNAYYDEAHSRVYQFQPKEERRYKKLDFSIKTYRQDYVRHEMPRL